MARHGFVRAAGARLVDHVGDPVLLRGVGLGNWLLPEGYMFRLFSPAPQSPREIEALIVDLVGETEAAAFWRGFRDRWIAERDVEAIAAAGMNHVRLPINARGTIADDGSLIPDGIAHVDRLIEWCRRHHLWVILDLHGAPGGQTGTNIDDSPNGKPELFTNTRNRELTIELWRMLAERYCNNTTVAGYDLLNEPLPEPHAREHSAALISLYRDLTEAIREVDTNHLLIYEGTHWATNWEIFTEVWDENSALSFHKYWSPPDRPSIETFLERREALGLPIYMGEGGENGLGWLQTAFQLYDDCEISWNFWPWKKLDTYSSPCSVTPPHGWSAIEAYARGGERPARSEALDTLEALLRAMQFDHCVYRPEVVAALRRFAPMTLSPAGFGFRGRGRSYETSAASPLTNFRSDDKVTVCPLGTLPTEITFEYEDGPDRNEQPWQVELLAGDWLAYEFGTRDPRAPVIAVHGECAGEGALEVAIEETRIACEQIGGDWVASFPRELSPGRHQLRLLCVAGALTVTGVSIR